MEQRGGIGSLHQEGPPGCKERSSKEAEGRAVPGGLAFPSGQWESKAGSARTLSTSQHRPELQVREDPAHTTANLPPKEPRLPHLLLRARLRSGGLPSPQPKPVGMALTLHLSVHLFPAPPAPHPAPLLHEGNVTGMTLTETRIGLDTGCWRHFLRYPQLMRGRSLPSLKGGSLGLGCSEEQ